MKKILIIEDEAALQKMMGDLLSQEGYKIIPAFNGKAGLDLAKNENPDLIILDLVMPQVDGFEVLEKLKREKDTQQIPVIVLTNLEAMDTINRVIELGAAAYLIKANYELYEVLEKVKQILGEAKAA